MWLKRASIVVLFSGNGTNLQAIIEAISLQKINGYIACVVCNNKDAYGIKRAKEANLNVVILDHKQYNTREEFDRELADKIEDYHPDLIVLAGFMRILSKEFILRFSSKIINIHPSLLPKYPGLNTHARVIESGERDHGVSVHYVTEDLDGGPICAQSFLRIESSSEDLEKRIHDLEYRIYPFVINLITTRVMKLENKVIYLNNDKISTSGLIFEDLR